jgi:hypothetical protein
MVTSGEHENFLYTIHSSTIITRIQVFLHLETRYIGAKISHNLEESQKNIKKAANCEKAIDKPKDLL